MKTVKYIGQDGGTNKALLTKDKLYTVIREWSKEWVVLLDDSGEFVDVWVDLLEVIE